MRKRIGIIGASGAGIYASLFIAKRHPEYEIFLFDHKKTLGKKLLATGNGHCNLLPAQLDKNAYRHPDWFEQVRGEINLEALQDILFAEGISLRNVNGLYYPESYNAPSFVAFLQKRIDEKHIHVSLETEITGYQKSGNMYRLNTSKGDVELDEIIFAFGGKSQANLGSDGSLFGVLSDHGYRIDPLTPGLTPVQTKEATKRLSGIRHEAILKLVSNGKTIYEEHGEVLFKKDGLSGICVMNAESVWARNGFAPAEIHLDFYPEEDEKDLAARLLALKAVVGETYLGTVLVDPLREYVEEGAKRLYGQVNPASIAKVLKDLVFHPLHSYGFDDSQVTIGGIDREEVDENLQSKKEKGIFFIGECLDNDGLCGGNNLAWCLLTALKAKEAI